MPALLNPKHERFAQELAKGVSQYEAHGLAGYNAHRGNASSLAQDKNVVERVAEIRLAHVEMAREATQRAADALALTREWVLERLKDNALNAAANEDYGPSNKALELIGKEIGGMFVDRTENKHTITQSHEDMLDALDRMPMVDDVVTARH